MTSSPGAATCVLSSAQRDEWAAPVFAVVPPTDEQLRTFRSQLWKEQRSLEMIGDEDDTRRLRKSFQSRDAVDAELYFLQLVNEGEPGLAPEVVDVAETSIDLRYVEGTRVHTVLTLLQELERVDARARAQRERLVRRCASSCARIQELLTNDMRTSPRARAYYPVQEKLTALLGLFDSCLQLDLDMDTIEAEASSAEAYLRSIPCPVPFRDATAKNLVMEIPDMWLGRCSVAEQREFVRHAVAVPSSATEGPLDRARIVHLDFSSCSELTVPEDDPISLLVHESSWLGEMPAQTDLRWLPIAPDPIRLAVGLLVRMYRLGGRRLSYRLVHRDGYQLRYADESIAFYFEALVSAGDTLCPELVTHFPALMLATRAILHRLAKGLETERDWFRDRYQPQLERYYRDVFPY
jgi:hypothetical protein